MTSDSCAGVLKQAVDSLSSLQDGVGIHLLVCAAAKAWLVLCISGMEEQLSPPE